MKNDEKRIRTSVCLLVLGASVVLMNPMEVDAKWTRSTAFDCKTFNGSPKDMSWALMNDSPTSSMQVLCNLPESDYYPKGNITLLNLHARDGTTAGRVEAMACASAWWEIGGWCGPKAVSEVGNVTDVTLQPNLGQWLNDGNFGYLWIELPPRQGSSRSSINGYFTVD
ncbi:hypothetical protein [Paraliomyxa miuraensis]|uniref:hypothetical protein n=1 Tax=Paraliomyxa miuraensis TaxID=376150 RepID=UPI00224E90ED|nr:hypothetical protein [Paraliomyxa miuraensis]MCX4240947.1 hypothetical protein [Paraliomyxa miuraensis]